MKERQFSESFTSHIFHKLVIWVKRGLPLEYWMVNSHKWQHVRLSCMSGANKTWTPELSGTCEALVTGQEIGVNYYSVWGATLVSSPHVYEPRSPRALVSLPAVPARLPEGLGEGGKELWCQKGGKEEHYDGRTRIAQRLLSIQNQNKASRGFGESENLKKTCV